MLRVILLPDMTFIVWLELTTLFFVTNEVSNKFKYLGHDLGKPALFIYLFVYLFIEELKENENSQVKLLKHPVSIPEKVLKQNRVVV